MRSVEPEPAEVVQRTGVLLGEAGRPRLRDGFEQERTSGLRIASQLDRAERDERSRGGSRIAGAERHRPRALGALDASFGIAVEPRRHRSVGIDERQLGAVVGACSQPSSLCHRLLSLAQQPTAVEVCAELGQVAGLVGRSAFCPAVRDRLAHHGDRLELVVGQVAGPRAAFEELGASARGEGCPARP